MRETSPESLEDNDCPETTAFSLISPAQEIDNGIRKLKEQIETTQLRIEDEKELNRELSHQNAAKDEVIKNLLNEVDSMRGEKKKTEVELKDEM